LVPDISRG